MRIFPTRRGWKRLGIALAILLALGLIANGIMAWRTEHRLQAKIAAIRAAGDPASIAELAPKPIPDEENAAATLQQIRPRLEEFGGKYAQFFNSPLGKEYEHLQAQGEAVTHDQIQAIRDILGRYSDVEQALLEASNKEKYASRLDFSLDHPVFIEHVIANQQVARTATRFLGWRGDVLMMDGQHEQAIEIGMQALRLARLHENEPTLLASLVAIAMRGIANEQLYDALIEGPISPELHAALDEELARQDDSQRLVRMLKMERAVGARWLYAELQGGTSALAHIFGWPVKRHQIAVIDVMGECVRLAERPWYELRNQFGPVDGQPPPTGHGVMADLLMPAIKASFQAHTRSLAVSRCLRMHNALREFAELEGREASGLAELELPKQATLDPFSGQPLKLKHTNDGWVIYSVMENAVDDGGDFRGLKDFGVAPRKHRLTE